MKRLGDTVKFMIGVDDGKGGIMYEAGVKEPGPSYMHFPIDYRAGYDREYFKGLISERMIIKRRNGQSVVTWEKFYERNEPLDCRNYARAAYRYFHWPFNRIERALKGEEEKIITQEADKKRKQRYVISQGIRI